jgi:hypothetical protein
VIISAFQEPTAYLEDEVGRLFRNVADRPQDCKVTQIDHSANLYLLENVITFLLSSVVNTEVVRYKPA